MDITRCPECGEAAEIEWRSVLEGTDGPVEHAKVLCVRRHWFLLPVARLAGGLEGRCAPTSTTGRHAATGPRVPT